MLAALLTLASLALTAGTRARSRLKAPAENNECPLRRDGQSSELIFRGQGEGGDCCDNGAHLFNCDVVRFAIGDEVKWDNFDEDIPEDTIGVVKKIALPDVLVKFPQGLFKMEFDDLVPVNGEPEDERWHCKCNECLEVEKLVSLSGYKVERKAQHLRSWADFDTNARMIEKWTVAPKGLVLFLYPSEDHNHAFAYREMLCKRISCWHQRGYDVSMRVVRSLDQARHILDGMADRSVHHIVIGGHGTETSISWANGNGNRLAVSDPETAKFLLKLRAKLMLDASVTLDSCRSAGHVREGSNIWKFIAKQLPGRQVKGATMDLKEHMWSAAEGTECVSGDTAVFKEHGVTKMRVRLSGKSLCEEVKDMDVEAAVAEGKVCLSACRVGCKATLQTLKGKTVITGPFTLEDPSLPPEADDCLIGTRAVCRFAFAKN